MLALSQLQQEIIGSESNQTIFVEGIAGSGKTTIGVERVRFLLSRGIPSYSILLLVPQRTLGAPYRNQLQRHAGGLLNPLTLGGLSQRMVDLFWPLAAQKAGFAHPEKPPTFLTLESSQYYMAYLVRPLFDQGYFESATIPHNRIYGQILDNLNKSALVGFPFEEVGDRLKKAWQGESSHLRLFDDAQKCASLFRQYCLNHNLLDYSLQVQVFAQYLWSNPLCHDYLTRTFRHLIVDNVEEDTPFAHSLIQEWLPSFTSAMLLYDRDGGYRRFLGADPNSGHDLQFYCNHKFVLPESFVMKESVRKLGRQLSKAIRNDLSESEKEKEATYPQDCLQHATFRYTPQMVDWVVDQIDTLIHKHHVPPKEIVVLSPFLPDALRFSLTDQLSCKGIQSRSHRPSRALRDESVTQCLLTILMLAHPQWGMFPPKYDVTYALMQIIPNLDLVRASLLAEIVYRRRQTGLPLIPVDEKMSSDLPERITFVAINKYSLLRDWLADYVTQPEETLDIFFSRLFGEVLSQPGYSFHLDFNAAEVASNLIESARKFRWAFHPDETEPDTNLSLGKEYLAMVNEGVLAAQYVQSWQMELDDAILLSPASTFLMYNRPVDHQFWLDVGNTWWSQPLSQPLTNPYVLSQSWLPGDQWTDENEIQNRQDTLLRLSLGLIRRCRKMIHLGICEKSEWGFDQKGSLLKAFQRVIKDNLDLPLFEEDHAL